MFPKPTAEPIAAKINALRPAKVSRLFADVVFVATEIPQNNKVFITLNLLNVIYLHLMREYA